MITPEIFEALSDRTRIQVVELLAERERTAGEIAAEFQISRPAVSRHLRVLRETGVVAVREEAQRRVYRLEPGRIVELSDWLDTIRSRWKGTLDALESHLESTRRSNHESYE